MTSLVERIVDDVDADGLAGVAGVERQGIRAGDIVLAGNRRAIDRGAGAGWFVRRLVQCRSCWRLGCVPSFVGERLCSKPFDRQSSNQSRDRLLDRGWRGDGGFFIVGRVQPLGGLAALDAHDPGP